MIQDESKRLVALPRAASHCASSHIGTEKRWSGALLLCIPRRAMPAKVATPNALLNAALEIMHRQIVGTMKQAKQALESDFVGKLKSELERIQGLVQQQ